jgi:uncharacterized membrane protein
LLIFRTKFLLGLGVAPNFPSCSFGLPFLSVSNALLQMPYSIEIFSRALPKAYCYKQVPTGVYYSCLLFSMLLTKCSLQMLLLALKLIFSALQQHNVISKFELGVDS